MKKILALLLVFAMMLALVACGNKNPQVTDPSDSSQATTESTEAPTTIGTAGTDPTNITENTEATEETTGATQTPTTPPTQETTAPTQTPTTPPTQETTAPTQAPTVAPTQAPTVAPTQAPTTPPTQAPTTPPATCAKGSHVWLDATCTAPQTCAVCGLTEGTPRHLMPPATCTKPKTCTVCGLTEGTTEPHRWQCATCTTPRTCENCNTTEGVATGHSWKAADCSAAKTCIACKKTEGNPLGHSWNASKTCTKCGASAGSTYGYGKLTKPAMQTLYKKMLSACEAFVGNKGAVTPTDGKYIIAQITFDTSVITAEDAAATWKIFTLDNPRYYWLSNAVHTTGSTLELCIDPLYADGAYRSQCDTALANMVAECSKTLTAAATEAEKAMAIHAFIIGRMNYAYEADGQTPEDAIWAHNMMGCAEKKSGVCEAYAESYLYLCRMNGLDCIIATGTHNAEEHAWNLVKIDGKWYGVDSTLDDQGADPGNYVNFGMNAEKMQRVYEADTPKDTGVDYLYPLPQLAEHNISRVGLYKNGKFVDICLNIDAAFSLMTDPNGEYEVCLLEYGCVDSPFINSDIVKYHIAATKTPAVKSISLRGINTDLGNDLVALSALYIDNDLVLQSNLGIRDLAILGDGTLELKNKKVSFFGEVSMISIPVAGNMDNANPSELYTEAGRVEFYESVRVHSYREGEKGGGFLFRNDMHIVKVMADGFTVYASINPGMPAHIEEYCPPEGSFGNFICIKGNAKVTVDKITSPNEPVSLTFEFGKLEEFGTLTIGSCDAYVNLELDGMVSILITDASGNEVGRRTELAKPEDLTVPIITLRDKGVMDKMRIFFSALKDGKQTTVEHTDEYILNSKNQVVRK